MNAPRLTDTPDLSLHALQAAFLASVLPKVLSHARVSFRHLRSAELREEYTAEMLALSWAWHLRLAQRGKDAAQFPSAIAKFAARAVRSGRKLAGTDRANDALLEQAAANYQKAAERLDADRPDDAKLKKLALQYLVATYGADKLNDPSRAEPVVQRMIQLDPSDLETYFILSKIYEDAGAFDNAEQALVHARDVKPNDPDVYTRLAAFYNRRGHFDRTIAALEQRGPSRLGASAGGQP